MRLWSLWSAMLVSGCSSPPPGEEEQTCASLPLDDALLTSGAWDPSLTVAGLSGQDGYNPVVHDLALDGDDVLAAGYFSWAGTAPVPAVVRRTATGWTGAAEGLDAPVISAIAADGGTVAVATFEQLPWDLAQRTGEILVSEGGGPFEVVGRFHGAVRSLVWFDGALWVAGVFSLDDVPVEGGTAAGLVRLGDDGWHDLGLVGLGAYELEPDGDGLLIGGAFDALGGVPARNVARWDGAAVTALDLPDGTVFALARDAEGALYAGGLLSVEGSYEVGGIARLDGASWTSVGGGLANRTFRGVVSDLALHQGALVVGGCFSRAGGVDVADVAQWDGAWAPLAEADGFVASAWYSPLACGDEGPGAIWEARIQRLRSDGERLFVAGSLAGLGGVPSQGVIRWEGGRWRAEGEAGGGLSGAPRALAVGGPDCDVHTLGGITHAGALPVQGRVVRRGAGAWVPVTDPTPGEICGALAVADSGAVHVGCETYPTDAEVPLGSVHTWMDDGWALRAELPDGGVAALGLDDRGRLWAAGGAFTGYVERIDGDQAVRVGTFDGRVGAIAFGPDGDVVVGGTFTEVDGVATTGVARLRDGAWEALGDGPLGQVLAVAVGGDGAVYASTADDGTPGRTVLGRWDGSAWQDVAAPEPGPVDAGYAFSSLVARGGAVVAAGFAWPGSDERHVFVWDGASFRSLAGGVTAISVDAAALAGDGLWFGGPIALAGPPGARVPSVGIAHLR